MSQYLSLSSLETKRIGRELAKKVLELSRKNKKAIIIGLKGELGGGKTTFLQAFASGLGIKEKILSPTFVIYRRYKIKDGNFYHFDCYRIKKSEEMVSLGFNKIIKEEGSIIALEWADKIREIMPSDSIWVNFSFLKEKERKIIVNL